MSSKEEVKVHHSYAGGAEHVQYAVLPVTLGISRGGLEGIPHRQEGATGIFSPSPKTTWSRDAEPGPRSLFLLLCCHIGLKQRPLELWPLEVPGKTLMSLIARHPMFCVWTNWFLLLLFWMRRAIDSCVLILYQTTCWTTLLILVTSVIWGSRYWHNHIINNNFK